MTVYALFEVTLRADADERAIADYERYRAAVPALIEQAGGRYMARGWAGEALEGGAAGDRFHLVEFETADAARAFWASPDYRAIQPLRADAAEVRAILIEPAPQGPSGTFTASAPR